MDCVCINQRQLRSSLFCSVTQYRLVLGYWSFGATYQSLLQGTAWLLKTGPVSYPKMSITNYHSTLHNISTQQRPHLQHGRSLRPHTGSCFVVQRIKLLLPVTYMAMKIHTTIFWGVTPCSLVSGYQHFTGAYCLNLHPANKCTMLLLNICTCLPIYTLSHPSNRTQKHLTRWKLATGRPDGIQAKNQHWQQICDHGIIMHVRFKNSSSPIITNYTINDITCIENADTTVM